jgi:hypothetical protein
VSVAFEWQPRDLWVGWFGPKTEREYTQVRFRPGVYGTRTRVRYTVWLILPPLGLPCLPLRISWTRKAPREDDW